MFAQGPISHIHTHTRSYSFHSVLVSASVGQKRFFRHVQLDRKAKALHSSMHGRGDHRGWFGSVSKARRSRPCRRHGSRPRRRNVHLRHRRAHVPCRGWNSLGRPHSGTLRAAVGSSVGRTAATGICGVDWKRCRDRC